MGLENFIFIGEDFEIVNNDGLMSLIGLDQFIFISGNFIINFNVSLLSLVGLENFDVVMIDDFFI